MPARRNGSRKNSAKRLAEEEFDEAMRWLSPLPNFARRWEEAARLVKVKPGERQCNDAAVAAAAEYLDALARCTTDHERAAVQRQSPEITEARAIFDADNPCRWELEAYLLSGESDEEVAARLGLSPHTVATFVSLFCAMRDFVDQPEWLASKMFGCAFTLHFRDNQLREFWAWVGICGGPVLLKRVIAEFHAAWQPGTPTTLSAYLRADAPVSLSAQALVASLILPSNAKTAPILFETHLGLIEADRLNDPARKKEKIDQLKRTMIGFTRGFLDGKSAEELLRLLRYPPNLERVQAKMRALLVEGDFDPLLAVQGTKPFVAGSAGSPELAVRLPQQSGAPGGA
jgi:hypothetical protein